MYRSVQTRLLYLVMFSFAILLYLNTLKHGFVLDDDVVILKNTYVQQGFQGLKPIFWNDSFAGYERIGSGESLLVGGRYRPLSLGLFAILYSLFGSIPIPFHVLNIFLYAMSGVLIFSFLTRLLREETNGRIVSFVCAMLFLAHPIHVEVVANAKSADELLVILFGITSLYVFLKAYDDKSRWWLFISTMSFFIACLAKENAITLILIAPLSLWFFRKASLSKTLVYSLPLLIGALAFLWIRQSVIGDMPAGRAMHDPLNNPFLEWNGSNWITCDPMTRIATIIYIGGQHLRLMFLPFPLTHDYYPFHIALKSFSSSGVWLSLIGILSMLGLGVWGFVTRHIAAFGVLFFLITASLTANIIFPVGVFFAERFLFLPSLGLIFSVTWILAPVFKKYKKVSVGLLMLLTTLLSFLTIQRNQAWKDNETLMTTDIKVSGQSAKLRNALGIFNLDKALVQSDFMDQKKFLDIALPNFDKAIALHPTYYDALLARGACHYYLGNFESSVADYRMSAFFYPGDERSLLGLRYAIQAYSQQLWEKADPKAAVAALIEIWEMQKDTTTAMEIASRFLEMNDQEKAIEWQAKAKPAQ